MPTIRKRTLKDGSTVFDIQVKLTDKGSGKKITHTTTWKPDAGMTDKKAQRQVILVADQFAKEIFNTLNSNRPQEEPTNMTFRMMCDKWLEKTKRDGSLSYYVMAQKELEFACSKIGGYRLRELTPYIIQEFFDFIDNRKRTITVITPKPNFKDILASYGFCYKNLRYDYGTQSATLAHALKGNQVGAKWSAELCRATKIPFDKLFNKEVTKAPYAYETNSKIKRTVRAVLSLAKKKRLIEDNYAQADYIDYPRKEKTPIRFMDDKTATTFFTFLMNYDKPKLKTAMLILLFTGLRRGELCGLEWKDIDFQNHTISVRRTVVYVAGYGKFEKEPKTEGSVRKFTMSDTLETILKEYKTWWEDMVEKCGDYMQPTDKLFHSEKGGLINPATVETWIKIVLRDAKMEHYTLHSLRHTNITLQIASGIPLVTVAARAGHSRTSTTGDIYSHFITTSDQTAANALDNIFSNESDDK